MSKFYFCWCHDSIFLIPSKTLHWVFFQVNLELLIWAYDLENVLESCSKEWAKRGGVMACSTEPLLAHSKKWLFSQSLERSTEFHLCFLFFFLPLQATFWRKKTNCLKQSHVSALYIYIPKTKCLSWWNTPIAWSRDAFICCREVRFWWTKNFFGTQTIVLVWFLWTESCLIDKASEPEDIWVFHHWATPMIKPGGRKDYNFTIHKTTRILSVFFSSEPSA